MNRIHRLTAKQEKLIGCLLTERTIEQACEKAGVAVVTYWRWMQQVSFARAYRKARIHILEGIVAQLQGLTVAAVDTLERNLNCENPTVEIRAASIILDHAAKGVEALDLEQRLQTIEDQVREDHAWDEQSPRTGEPDRKKN
jgi:hypothetical protein